MKLLRKIAEALCRGCTGGDLRACQAAWCSTENAGRDQRLQLATCHLWVST